MEGSVNTGDKFTYVWKVKNLSYSTLNDDEFIESPIITIPQFFNTTWCLRLGTKREPEHLKDYISCFMHRGKDGPKTIKIKYNLFWNSKENSFPYTYSFPRNYILGYNEFLPLENKENCKDLLVIVWEMQLCDFSAICGKGYVENFLSSNLDANAHFSKIVEEFKKLEMEGESPSNKKALAFPARCVAETHFIHDKRTIQWPIDYLINCSKSREIIPFIISEQYPSLLINLKEHSQDESFINVEIYLCDDTVLKKFLVICELRILNQNMDPIYLLQDQYTYTCHHPDQTWSFKDPINKLILKKQMNKVSSEELAHLELDFIFVPGIVYSKISCIDHININGILPVISECNISKKIINFYKYNKLCDAVLKVNKTTFNVHKVVLGASSPVFAAMFTTEMLENKSNTVNIIDFNEDTVAEIISFMYTESLNEIDFEKAKQLFIAGDKYQILSLKNLCRNALISFMDLENICEILSLADTFSDWNLEKESVKFLKLYAKHIFTSIQWDKFEKENMSYAIKIYKQVCLLGE